MKGEYLVYSAYMMFFILLMGATMAVPFLAFSSDMSGWYKAFGYTCHQKLSRSLCLFSDGKGYSIADCTPQTGQYVGSASDREQVEVRIDGMTGYKFPICARDMGIYGAMLLGGLAYPFMRNIRERKLYPALWLALALVPLAVDGGVQFISDVGLLPLVYESSNMLRLATGAIAGFAAAVYTIPLLVNLFTSEPKTKRA